MSQKSVVDLTNQICTNLCGYQSRWGKVSEPLIFGNKNLFSVFPSPSIIADQLQGFVLKVDLQQLINKSIYKIIITISIIKLVENNFKRF